MAEPVAELNPLDDLGQAVLAVEFAPFLLRQHHQPEGHGQAGLPAARGCPVFKPGRRDNVQPRLFLQPLKSRSLPVGGGG